MRANSRPVKGQPKSALRFLAGYLRPHLGLVVLGALLAAAALACQLALPWTVGTIIDDALTNRDMALLAWNARLLALLAVGLVVFGALQKFVFTSVGGHVLQDLHAQMLSAAQSSPLADHHERPVGEVVSLFTSDALSWSEFYEYNLSEAIRSLLQVLATAALLLAAFPKLVAVILLVSPLYIALAAPIGKPTRKAARAFRTSLGEIGGRVQESLLAVAEIKAFNRTQWNLDRLVPSFKKLFRDRLRLRLLKEAFGVNVIAFWGLVSIVYWFGGLQVAAGALTVGSLVALVSYCGILQQPFIRLAAFYSETQAVLGSIDRVAEFLTGSGTSSQAEAAEAELAASQGRVEMNSLRFGYEQGRAVLHDLSLVVHPGQTVAIVGPSGAGKSTLLRLLLRLYEPHQGEIYIDGQDICQVSKASLRRAVGVVFENTMLFGLSIRENIRFGDLTANDMAVVRAAKAANAHGFISRLPEGYDTLVGERGVKLSNGERQRISIARTILRDPPILLLDEATSALDAESEKDVNEALRHLMEKRTSLTVSHRLWTVVRADLIVVLDQGRIVDSGPHSVLIERCALYRRLLQLQGMEESAPRQKVS